MPYGLAQIMFTYPDPEKKQWSFEGVGVFCDGKLHMGPFTCQNGLGSRKSYSLMFQGRPANHHYYTEFLRDGYKLHLGKKKLTDESGCEMISS